MTSNRPYLLRAVYDWISDNHLTPYLLVDAGHAGVRVPASAIRDGKVVLNIAMRAVADIDLGNERIRFKARFGGVSQMIDVPVDAVLAIYAHENGQGMMLPREEEDHPRPVETKLEAAADPVSPASAPESTLPSDPPPPKGPPKLRIIK